MAGVQEAELIATVLSETNVQVVRVDPDIVGPEFAGQVVRLA